MIIIENKQDLKQIDKIYFENPEKYIPIGHYCAGCIFLDKDTTKPYQMNGYCHYLKKGDWNLNEESIIIDVKSGKQIPYEQRKLIPMGLLWDGCKECEINDYEKWCIDCKHSKKFSGYSCECELLSKIIEDMQSGCENFELE